MLVQIENLDIYDPTKWHRTFVFGMLKQRWLLVLLLQINFNKQVCSQSVQTL